MAGANGSTDTQASNRGPIHLTPLVLTLLVILFTMAFDNFTFWGKAVDVFSGHFGLMAVYSVALFFLTLSFFSLFSFPYVVKPFLVFILILSAVTSYYMENLGVVVDRDMIQNAMVTTVTEAKHLITLSFVIHVLLYGVLPSLFVMFAVTIKPQPVFRRLAVPVLVSVLSFALTIGLLLTGFKTYSSILRERKDFMASHQPGSALVGAVRYARMVSSAGKVVVAPIGQDAKKGPAFDGASKPTLTIVVAGETARSMNFSLNGYGVDTNPELEKLPVVSFTDVNSCGTATAVSLPCMFSKFGRSEYSYKAGISNENLLDVLQYAGFDVEWWDNNTGDKDIADRVTLKLLTHTDNAEFCGEGECIDGIFMQHLQEYVAGMTQDTVLVLHQAGSHGPAYYLRYPQAFEKFKPACRTAEFKNCTPQEIVNVYDNTIAYTDKTLADTIRFLQSQTQLNTAMFYVSDHGESLGESGLYLHGSPYFMAPEYQTKVPMIVWLSKSFEAQFGISKPCLDKKKDETLSHANMFHSILGLLDVSTNVYDPALDIFASCKS